MTLIPYYERDLLILLRELRCIHTLIQGQDSNSIEYIKRNPKYTKNPKYTLIQYY